MLAITELVGRYPYYTHRRMRKLGLDRILDYIYSPQDHDLPEGMTPEQIRMYPKDEYGLRRSAIRHTPKGELKPNPDILLQIIRDIGASPSETLYIGDSLMKDVAMANSAHVSNAWAKYGQAQNRPEYELLRKVTHWSSSAVEKEKGISEVDVEPTIVLENSLAEIMKPFSFERFTDRSEAEIATVLDAWSKTVDVQMHFNELAMKIRNFALTILGVILAGAAFSIKERTELVIFGTNVPLVSLLLVVGAAVWIAFYLMDRHWYHRLLIGSVRHGIAIENRHSNALPELGLATAIGAASPSQIISWRIHSSTKLDLFYLFGAAMLIVAAVCSFFIATKNNVPSSVAPTPAQSAAIPATTTNDNTQRQQVDEEGKTQPPGNSPNVDDNGQGEKQ